MTDRLFIFDTTLRDGEQSPGASMTKDEKLRIARQLERLKVDVIEAGFAASSNGDFEAVRAIAHAIKGATLIGSGPESLTRVSMIGNDMKLDSGIGTCGKNGQSVPVGVGQPTLRIDGLTVGGTAA